MLLVWQDGTLRLQDFIKRASALADAQQRTGDGAAALSTLASSLVVLASLGFESPDDWRPLVTAYVRLKAQLLSQQGGVLPAAAPPHAARGSKACGRSRAVAGRSKTAAAEEAAEEAGGTASLAATMLQRGLARSAVTTAEQELQAWHAQANHPELGDDSRAEASRLVNSFLQLWPADRDPTAHARLLLLLFKLRLTAGGCAERELLARAAQVLGSQAAAAMQGRAAVLSQVQAALALDGAQQLVQEAVEQQKHQQRCESHAAASTSTSNAEHVAPSYAPPLPAVMAKAWKQVREQAEGALRQLEEGDAAGEQLQFMLGLQGHSSDVLLGCLLPGAGDVVQDAAVLQAEAQRHAVTAASALRSTEVILQRVSLHQQAAEQLAAGGRMVEALYEASEAHRLAAALFHGDPASISSASGCWWQLAANYAACLMQLGMLYELAGLPDEALHALKEGHRLVRGGQEGLAAVAAHNCFKCHNCRSDNYCSIILVAGCGYRLSSAGCLVC